MNLSLGDWPPKKDPTAKIDRKVSRLGRDFVGIVKVFPP
jgi:hypothetical protein